MACFVAWIRRSRYKRSPASIARMCIDTCGGSGNAEQELTDCEQSRSLRRRNVAAPVRVSMYFEGLIRSVFSDTKDCQWHHNLQCIHNVLSALARMLVVHHHATHPTIWRLSASKDSSFDFSFTSSSPAVRMPELVGLIPHCFGLGC